MIFTAHSLPERIRETGDTYPEQLAESARLVADRGRARRLAGGLAERGTDRPSPGSAPTCATSCGDLAADDGTDAVVVCPIGFVADHLEVLYDLDVEAGGASPRRAASATRAPPRSNDDPAFIAALADLIVAADEGALRWRRGGSSSSAAASAGSPRPGS